MLFCILFSACALLPVDLQPKIVEVRPRITGVDLQSVQLAFEIDVKNPYPLNIAAPNLNYGLSIDGHSLISADAITGLAIPAGGVSTSVVPATVRFTDLWELAQGLSGANQAIYRLEGGVGLDTPGGLMNLPFVHEGILPILQAPKFSDIRVQPLDYSLSGAKIELDANVENPNMFGIGIRDLGYDLQIGSLRLAEVLASAGDELGAEASGPVHLVGEVSMKEILAGLLEGFDPGGIQILPTGQIQTPYGAVDLAASADE